MGWFLLDADRMKIGITIEKLDLRRGGAEGAALWLIGELARRGHVVHVLARDVSVDLPLGVRFRQLRVRPLLAAFEQCCFASEVARHLRDGAYDVSIACGRGYAEDIVWAQNGAQSAAIEGQARSYYYSPWLGVARRLQHWYSLRAWAYRHLENRRFARQPGPHVIAVSQMVADDVHRLYGLGRGHITVVHNHMVIDHKRFNPSNMAAQREAARSALHIGKGTVVFLCVAQNFRRKGVRPLIEATAELLRRNHRNFSVMVAGGTPKYAAPYRKYAKKLGCASHVYFVGHRRQVDTLYAAADVFCLPTFYDPCALTVSEAMASGLPCVSTSHNGASELITHNVDGFVVQDPHDARELADCMQPLLDPVRRAHMANAALEAAQRIDVDKAADQLVTFIEKVALLKQKSSAAASAPVSSPAV
jgi:UDP-glucose:(heptosyl)LPS alpha-1,3-glucosyltransferase